MSEWPDLQCVLLAAKTYLELQRKSLNAKNSRPGIPNCHISRVGMLDIHRKLHRFLRGDVNRM